MLSREKQASSEIAQSRARFEKLAEDAGFDVEDYDFAAEAYCDIEADAAWRGYQWAERDTRERLKGVLCAAWRSILKADNGWDERDYKLWSAVRVLPSYGIIAPDDRMVSQKAVEKLLHDQAEARFDAERSSR